MNRNQLEKIKNAPISDETKNAIKVFAYLSQQENLDLCVIFGALVNAIEQNRLGEFALFIARLAQLDGLDNPIDFSDIHEVKL